MQLTLTLDESGRYVCELAHEDQHTTVTASNVPEAGADLLAGLEDARETGLGESLWVEPGGEYRWMFRRVDDRVTVAVMWSSGTITGWQHVFRADGRFEDFVRMARAAVAGVTGS
jgi:hypothetical protein